MSDNLNSTILGSVVDVYSNMQINFNETLDMETEVKNIMETSDNLKRSLDYKV